jgi:ketosteroid isomerase-like protein
VLATTPEARRGRSLLERLLVRFPFLLHTGTRIVLRLPPDSRVRGRILWWAASRIYEGFNRHDWEMNMLAFDPADYEFRAGDLAGMLPGGREVYAGTQGYMEAMGYLLEEWSEIRVRLEKVIAVGGDRVITIIRFIGRGRMSGVPVEQRTAGLIEFRHGRVFRQTYWFDVERGLRSAGATAGEPHK